MVTTIKERPTVKKPRPTLKELGELIELYCGNIPALAEDLGYKPRQVYRWIREAPEALQIELMALIAKGRAIAKRARDLKQAEPLALLLPHEIKSLISLYYRLTWDQLMAWDVEDVLSMMDSDPEAPPSLRYKMSWADLRTELAGVAPDLDANGLAVPRTGYVGLESLTVAVGESHYAGWHQHTLMSWVGLNDQSPLWDHHDHLPQVIETVRVLEDGVWVDKSVPFGPHIEATVRLLIKRLEKYL